MRSAKMCLGMLFMSAMVMITGNTALAKTKVEQSGMTQNSIVVKWTVQSGGSQTTGYELRYMTYTDYTASGGSSKLNTMTPVKLSSNEISYQLNNLLPGTRYMVGLTRLITNKNGTVSSEEEKAEVYTAPGKVTGLVSGVWDNDKLQTNISWAKQDACDYEWEVRKNDNTIFATGNSNSTVAATITGLSAQMCYSARVRASVKDPVSHQKVYGDWSDQVYLFGQPIVQKVKRGSGSLKVYWKKIAGVTGYKVYVSTKQRSGYKKCKSLGSGKGYTTIKSFRGKKLSRKKAYYVYVVAEKKVGTQVIASKISKTWKVAKNSNKISRLVK